MCRPLILRLLRIAFSAGCCIVCLLLIALWVRSYYYLEHFGTPPQILTSWRGRLSRGGTVYISLTPDGKDASDPELRAVLGVLIITTIDQNNISCIGGSSLPIGALVLLMGTVAAAPWIRWRFSLRTLLIATTVVAAILGALVFNSTERTAQPPVDVGDFGDPN